MRGQWSDGGSPPGAARSTCAASAVRGHDYGCPEGLDLAALSNASSKAQRKEAAAVCRVCAAAAVAICEAHGERCAGFELNGAQLVLVLRFLKQAA